MSPCPVWICGHSAGSLQPRGLLCASDRPTCLPADLCLSPDSCKATGVDPAPWCCRQVMAVDSLLLFSPASPWGFRELGAAALHVLAPPPQVWTFQKVPLQAPPCPAPDPRPHPSPSLRPPAPLGVCLWLVIHGCSLSLWPCETFLHARSCLSPVETGCTVSLLRFILVFDTTTALVFVLCEFLQAFWAFSPGLSLMLGTFSTVV